MGVLPGQHWAHGQWLFWIFGLYFNEILAFMCFPLPYFYRRVVIGPFSLREKIAKKQLTEGARAKSVPVKSRVDWRGLTFGKPQSEFAF